LEVVTTQKSFTVFFVVKIPSGGTKATLANVAEGVTRLRMTVLDICEVKVMLPEAPPATKYTDLIRVRGSARSPPNPIANEPAGVLSTEIAVTVV
jgi:hypothetical protein